MSSLITWSGSLRVHAKSSKVYAVGSCEADNLLQSLESMEQELLPMRKQLHQLLGLPMDRPMLRMANALTFGTAGSAKPGAQLAGLLQCSAWCRVTCAQPQSPSCK